MCVQFFSFKTTQQVVRLCNSNCPPVARPNSPLQKKPAIGTFHTFSNFFKHKPTARRAMKFRFSSESFAKFSKTEKTNHRYAPNFLQTAILRVPVRSAALLSNSPRPLPPTVMTAGRRFPTICLPAPTAALRWTGASRGKKPLKR